MFAPRLTMMVKLNVPIFGQQRPNYCVPTCVKMVLEYVRKKHGRKIPRLSIKTIARVTKTAIDGTAPKDVERLNEILSRAEPSVEFQARFLGRFPEVIKELDEESPVIAWINVVEPPDVVLHAVVITGFDSETNIVFFNDPYDKTEKKEEIGVFIKKWGVYARLVKVLIGKKQQRYINEWATKTNSGEIG